MIAYRGVWGEFPRTGLLPRVGVVKPPNLAYLRDTLACMRSARLAVLLDVCCVLVFVVIGRASHTKGETLGGIASTSWPFLCGLAAGWVLTLAWRRPLALRPAGIGVWLGTVAFGMVLRVVSGQGTAAAFIGVALAFLGLFLLGWRLLARLVTR